MESWRRCILLMLLAGISQPSLAQDSLEDLLEPEVERRSSKEARIDNEDFELGIYGGVIGIEDFSSAGLLGLRAAYHLSEDFFIEANYAQATAGQTSFELLSGGAPFLTDSERKYRYYDLSLGYNLNGEMFLTDELVFNTATYFTLGAGSTDFAGDEHFTLSMGVGYRWLLTDYFAVHVHAKDHLFNSELIGDKKLTHNFEFALSATLFF